MCSALLFVSVLSWGQDTSSSTIDSLLNKAQNFYQTNIDSAVYYSNVAYAKAVKKRDTQKIAKTIGYKSTFFLSQKKNKEAISLLQFNLDNKSKLNPEDLGVTYNNLGVIYNLEEDDDTALEY